jgi:hypothetical protein
VRQFTVQDHLFDTVELFLPNLYFLFIANSPAGPDQMCDGWTF